MKVLLMLVNACSSSVESVEVDSDMNGMCRR